MNCRTVDLIAAVYTALLLSLAFLTIPITEHLRRIGIERYLVTAVYAPTVLGLGVALGTRAVKLSGVKIVVLTLIAAGYLLLFRSAKFDAEKIHLITYSLLAWLHQRSFSYHFAGRTVWIFAWFAASLVGVIDECLQIVAPGRFFQAWDIGLNASAALLFLTAKKVIS